MCRKRIGSGSKRIVAAVSFCVWLLVLAWNGGMARGTESTYNSTDVPKPIPDESTIESTTTVSGVGGLIEDINVKLNITHTWDADLSVSLVGPTGTAVELFSSVGGNGDNFTDTVLDDEASTPITSGTAPFRGSFRPAESLLAFNGLALNGTWTLRVTDDNLGDTGTLNSWSVTIRTADPPVIARMFPGSMANSGRVYMTILEGEAFQDGATVKLARVGQADIAAAGVQVVSSSRLTCRLNLVGAAEGLWSVQVTNPDGQSAVLADALKVWTSQPYLHAMGDNSYGQLGIGTNTWSPHPALIDDAVTVAAGLDLTVVLRRDGRVWQWRTDFEMIDLAGVVAVAAGECHGLALKRDGTVWAWGCNGGRLGDGTTTYSWSPVQVSGLTNVVAIAAGYIHSLAVKNDGTVWAWGVNDYGQLGDGTTIDRWTPVQVSGLTGVVAVGASWLHSLAVKSDGTVWAWGRNASGPLGDGTTTDRWTPVQAVGLTDVVAVAAGGAHSMALTSKKKVWAWGANWAGQLGDGTTDDRSTPAQISGLQSVVNISAGASHSLAIRGDGTVWAWGENNKGQLGDRPPTNRSSPVQVLGPTDVCAITASYFLSLAVLSDGTVWSWGDDSTQGQLGGGAVPDSYSPIQVPAFTNAVDIAAGINHGLAVRSDGTVCAWGQNWWGQLGNGTTNTSASAVQVSGLTNVTSVSAGQAHSLALQTDGTVWAWGANQDGQVGDGTTTDRVIPVQVSGLTGVVIVAGGGADSLALKSDGTVWAWGYNDYGQLGDGTTSDRLTPVQVSGLTGVVAIAEGGTHSLALKTDGTVWAWGYNAVGELGDGTTVDRSTPVHVANLTNVVALGVGWYHSLAVRSDGTVWAWGANNYGQLGDGTTTDRHVPVQVHELTRAIAVVGGFGPSSALMTDGTVWSWGGLFASPMPLPGLVSISIISTGYGFNLFLGSSPESAAPIVSGVWPQAGRTESVTQRIIVAFNEPTHNVSAEDLSLSTGTVVSVSGGGPYIFEVTGVVGEITATVGGDIVDNAGNALVPYQWTFTSCGPGGDSDADGVCDFADLCPNTIPGVAVDTQGCPPLTPFDFDRDGDVDTADLDAFSACFTGPAIAGPPTGCPAEDFAGADADEDSDVDQSDFGMFQLCFSGENNPADRDCLPP